MSTDENTATAVVPENSELRRRRGRPRTRPEGARHKITVMLTETEHATLLSRAKRALQSATQFAHERVTECIEGAEPQLTRPPVRTVTALGKSKDRSDTIGRPRTDRRQDRARRLSIYVTGAEHKMITEEADLWGLTKSEYARRRVTGGDLIAYARHIGHQTEKQRQHLMAAHGFIVLVGA